MTTKEIADQLVALCRAGRNLDAVDTLLSADVVSVETMSDGTMPAVMTGIEAVRGKNQWWLQNHVVHSAAVNGPFPNNDRFAVHYNFVVTPKVGPMAGKKMRMEEVALYTVADGKITREEFFYDMSNMGGAVDDAPAKRRSSKKKAARPAPKAKAKAKAGKKAVKVKVKAKARGKAGKAKAKKKASRRR